MRISSWLSISPRSFTDRYSSCRWASRGGSSWFCFSLCSARKSKYIRLQCKFFELHLRGFLLVVVVLPVVAQVRDQLIQSMRDSDPRVRSVFVYYSIRIFTPYLPCGWQVVTSNTGPILVLPLIQPFGSDEFSSLGKVYSRHVTGSANCENSSVSFVMKYCPTSTVVKNPASAQILITRFCCGSLSTRSCTFAIDQHKSPVLAWQILYSSHKSETAP